MKKKGLIISTVVMVVVLIASLTTATYAWFNTTASARISDLSVQTKAAEGLLISAFVPGGSEATAFSSGKTSWQTNAWKGENSGFGQSLDFDAANTIKYMGVTGDGITMYALNAPDAAFDVDGSLKDDAAMRDAVANQGEDGNGDYFLANIALRNEKPDAEDGKGQDVKIDEITVSVVTDANNPLSAGMAASLRIAIFAVDASTIHNTVNSIPADADFTFATLKAVVAPFAQFKFDAGSFSNNTTIEKGYKTYKPDQTLNENAEWVSGTSTYKQMSDGTFSTGFIADSLTGDTTPATTTIDASSVTLASNLKQHGVVYLRVVIWFEGEDNECIAAFAGGGATINISFKSDKNAGAGA